MEIRKIQTIKNYKSFSDFSWVKFCKDRSNNEQVLSNYSVIFGENGSGKSSICDILKSLSQIQDFPNTLPDLAEIEIKNGSNQVYKFENGSWMPDQLNKNSFLFFDVDFISANVHTHGKRSNQQGRHSQNSGKMIIDLDDKANQLKIVVKDKKEESDNFDKINAEILIKNFTDKDKELSAIYKDKSEQEIKDEISKKQEESKKIELDLSALQKINKKYSEISQLPIINQLSFSSSISTKAIYSELVLRQLKEKAQDQADEKIKAHFEKHKRFIETAKEQIPKDYQKSDCPLCMQPLANASKFIEYYRVAFDQTYENEKRKFLADIQNLKSELETLKSSINLLPTKVLGVFNSLEKIKTDFEIQDIYKLEEKTEYTEKFSKISITQIDELILNLEALKNIERKEIKLSEAYGKITDGVKGITSKIDDFNKLIDDKNKAISAFKGKYSDQSKITNEIQQKTKNQADLQETTQFLINDKIQSIKNQNTAVLKQKALVKALKKAQEDLKNHLANSIPESVIIKMIGILGKFNLSFTLEHIKPAQNTKDYSFSFKIKDQKGHERDFKDGLSEGERQLISLAFFFSINESLPNKSNIVLIFDDPITSLDSPNLKILADLIHEKTREFSQVIIFTHHPLFYKYVTKCENPNPHKFGVLKNHDAFGGSFIFFDPGFDLTTEVQKCSDEIKQNAQNGNLKPEEIALKYGQLLRLAVEKFIKHELLMWNKESNFEKEIIANLLKSKSKIQKLDDIDLEVMTNIYKYCNYSNLLHADKENPSALSELMTHIDKFVIIQNKVNL
ncbi:MAG: AAA family ATPase [Deltaproteobacteria bacterium]|nr:AAA family ATPase [Deltaproteobacteria bacterium]